ncbi:hypothetical protein [Salinarimonas soli]|uniref:Uncharacterized protein n=1 Tax=Salinarimonas soli TaxID=1638099 RepID=A0A5B2V7N8_9HYPH|nr:hypothetical protein [Salinarimonas soli]KAA2234788.1 hypothetical protein F0L46_22835 [Salinarimonas soli]
MRTILSLSTFAVAATIAGSSLAADFAVRRTSAGPAVGVPVVVDELYLRSNRCPDNPNCIAPRVAPVPSVRARAYVEVTLSPARPSSEVVLQSRY